MIISYFTIILIFIFICITIYYGGLKKVEIKEVVEGDFFVVYEAHKGDYKNIKKVIDRVYYDLIDKEKIYTKRGFGLYLDDPLCVEKNALRSLGGCIIDSENLVKKEDLQYSGFNTLFLKGGKALYTQFPYKGNFSVILSFLKVYPKLTKYSHKKGIEIKTIIEVYDVGEKLIKYYSFYDLDKKFLENLFE